MPMSAWPTRAGARTTGRISVLAQKNPPLPRSLPSQTLPPPPFFSGTRLAIAHGRDVIALDTKSQECVLSRWRLPGWPARVRSRRSLPLSTRPAFQLRNCHAHAVRSLDFNPNKQYHMVTAGDDAAMRFWDIRQTSRPLASSTHHTHWYQQQRAGSA